MAQQSQAELVKALIDAGIHFGHRVSRWNPKMAPYIHGKRNMIHIIDVKETLKGLLLAKRLITQTVAGGKDYAGKPRPVVIVQDDHFDGTDSITVVPLTSDATGALFRVPVDPDEANGLQVSSTIRKARLGRRLGALAPNDMRCVDRAMLVFLGLAG